MHVSVLCTGHRSATVEIGNGFAGLAPWPHRVRLDGRVALSTQHNVFTLGELALGTDFELEVESAGEQRRLSFRTRAAAHRIDVREFGARAGTRFDNTSTLQAAFSATPPGGLIEFPPGDWLTGPLFLKSGLHVYLADGARLLGHPDVLHWPVLPTVVGSWEGVPDTMHAGLLTAVGVDDVSISGAGCIDANAAFDTWWSRPKEKFIGRRPRTLYLVDATNVTVSGLTLLNAPSWAVHALRCRDLRFLDLRIEAPERSPNTDGINPESCANVRIAGARIATGDDCIALKSGRLSAAKTDFAPCENVEISNCILGRGHAAVALGSETSGGIRNVTIRDCIFDATDRGLRIKTRRGRGRASVIRDIRLSNVRMRAVGTPFVINCFYDCDADAKTGYVADRNARPIDELTPAVLNVSIEDVAAEKIKHCAAYVLGLPEQPVEHVSMQRYHVSMDAHATPGFPDRAASIAPVARTGLHFYNVSKVTMNDCNVTGHVGPTLRLENVGEIGGDAPVSAAS